MTTPLGGLRVLEASDYEAVQYAGRTLVSLGAEVLKMEPPGGDPLRRREPMLAGSDGELISVPFEFLNAGKKSMVFDPENVHAVSGVIDAADVVMATPEYAEALGLLARPRPETQLQIMIGPFGGMSLEDAPSTAFTRLHSGINGYIIPGDKDTERRPGWGGPYAFEAMHGIGLVVAVMAELRRKTGGVIDYSLQAYGLWLDKMVFPQVSIGAVKEMDRMTNAYPFGGNMACLDGFACVFIIEERQWRNLARAIGREDWLNDERFENGVRRLLVQDEIDLHLASWCAERTVDEVMSIGRAEDFPVGRVRNAVQVIERLSGTGRGFLVPDHTRLGDVTVTGLPFGQGLLSEPLGAAPGLDDDREDGTWRSHSQLEGSRS
jgi:crotonobetainyl-CoA:carnitine CoA-transferase CaiB-like acyl-CoA transferase